MPRTYESAEVEKKWIERWRKAGVFSVHDPERAPFTIVIPPPNVTGSLHMGHALNLSIQDAFIRIRKMKGDDVMWVPGMDHAGIATQNVVEKQLREEGKSRHDLGREKFVERAWAWKRQAESAIRNQLERLGLGCDWEMERFTLDDQCARAVRAAFKALFEEGLIYQAHRIINWCPRCQTALSDIEVEYEEKEGALYHFKYPVDGGGFAVIATTRPETMLGDTALAVHPDDERHKALHGKTATLPLVGRKIPIILDEYVDLEIGTGALKVTPAHDPNDFMLGKKHGLPEEIMLNYDGTIHANYPAYAGLDRFEARKRIVADLEKEGLFEKKVKHIHKVGQCQRCQTVIEPIVSLQWFVKTQPLAEPAIRAVEEGKTHFLPERWENTYFSWMREIQDWCISRQLWWGHRIPVWHCADCGKNSCEIEDITACSHCGSENVKQDEDVLDTWFSSGLWPVSTLGWPENTPNLQRHYPTSLLVTGFDIIFFWVARMMMFGLKFGGAQPFDKVYIHGLIRDDKGMKMSKSYGNVIDPLDIMDAYGTDALRIVFFMMGGVGQDIFLSEEKFAPGRNFCNKLYQTVRFILMKAENIETVPFEKLDAAKFAAEDRWILTLLRRLVRETDECVAADNLNQAALALHHFIWDEFCDWYLELCKPRLDGEDAEDAKTAKSILLEVMNRSYLALHPFMPFVTEEALSLLPGGEGTMAIERPWPTADGLPDDGATVERIQILQRAVSGIRDLRVRVNVPPKDQIAVYVKGAKNGVRDALESGSAFFSYFGRVESLNFETNFEPSECFSTIVDGFEFFIPKAAGNIEAELERLRKKREKTRSELEKTEKKLENEKFVNHAPADIVEKERERKAELASELEKIEGQMGRLEGV